jgi:hypothetical protein
MLAVHRLMFGEAGATCAEFILDWAAKLFDDPVDPLTLRIVLAPVELGPYNRHSAWAYPEAGMILGNRHICGLDKAKGIVLTGSITHVQDMVVHELCHFRQARLEAAHPQKRSRGNHRDPAWYQAISEAARTYLGVHFPPERWPKMKSVRDGNRVRKATDSSRISEVEATHFPESFRVLIQNGDPRLKCISSASVLRRRAPVRENVLH